MYEFSLFSFYFNYQHTYYILKKCFILKTFLLSALLDEKDRLYTTIAWSVVDPLRVVELPTHEYLLVFGKFAAYVDQDGKKSRDRQIMYPAEPTAIGK